MAVGDVHFPEIEDRINVCYLLLIDGYQQHEIVNHCIETHGWTVSKRQIRSYVKRAIELQQLEASRIDRRSEFVRSLSRYTRQYRKADEAGDVRAAIMAQSKIDELLSLHASDALTMGWKQEMDAAGRNADELRDIVLMLVQADGTTFDGIRHMLKAKLLPEVIINE
jgi:hypothetical protein